MSFSNERYQYMETVLELVIQYVDVYGVIKSFPQ